MGRWVIAIVCAGCGRFAFEPASDGASDGPVAGAAYQRAVLDDAPVAYFRFEEAAGSSLAVDASASGQPATFFGSPTYALTGAFAGSLSVGFDGDDYVAASLPAINTSPGARTTVEYWMLWNGAPRKIPIAFGTYDLMFWDDPGEFGFNTDQNEVWGVIRSDLAGRWVHVVAEFGNGNTQGNRLFIDGVEQSLIAVYGTPQSHAASSRFFIGRYESDEAGGYKFTGGIDEVSVYNYALSPSRISAHYQAAHAP